MSAFEYSQLSPDATQLLAQILAQCFISPVDRSQQYIDRIGAENFRVVRQADSIAGGLALISMRQWWGGQRVSMTGIAAVGIAPEHRGSGAALVLLQQTLTELFAAGVPISVLYPATQRLYRKVGYEQGGTYQKWSIDTAAIQMNKPSLPFHAVDPTQFNLFRPVQQQHAKRNNGHLDRNPILWQEIAEPEMNEPVYGYLIGNENQPSGYVTVSQHHQDDKNILRVRDWAALNAEAGQSLWAFFASHRSQIHQIRWRGGAIDPLTLLLPEQTMKLLSEMRWMLRIVNVPAALEKRGYPMGLEKELHLDIQDGLLPENNGKFVLSIANGQAHVERGGNGEMKLNISGLAPLYTGLFTPHQLALMGYLEASEAALNTATQLFAGSLPWLPDFF